MAGDINSLNLLVVLNIVYFLHLLHFRLEFFMEANSMNPDQTAPRKRSDLGPYCLQYRLAKNMSRLV